ncbi:MAG: asparagine synthase, partial [Chromatiaceae bacterium]
MYAICGWTGSLADAQASDQILDAMLLACGVAASGDVGRVRALGGHAGSAAGNRLVHADADILVVLSEPVTGDDGATLNAPDLARLYAARGGDLPKSIHGS